MHHYTRYIRGCFKFFTNCGNFIQQFPCERSGRRSAIVDNSIWRFFLWAPRPPKLKRAPQFSRPNKNSDGIVKTIFWEARANMATRANFINYLQGETPKKITGQFAFRLFSAVVGTTKHSRNNNRYREDWGFFLLVNAATIVVWITPFLHLKTAKPWTFQIKMDILFVWRYFKTKRNSYCQLWQNRVV